MQPYYYDSCYHLNKTNLNTIDTESTSLINLDQDIDTLTKKIARSARQKIKSSNISIRFLQNNELSTYEKKLRLFRKKRKLSSSVNVVDQELVQAACHYKDIFCKVIGGFQGDELVAGCGLIGFNKILLEVGLFRDLTKKNLEHPQDKIKYFIIQNGKNWGFNMYDLGVLACPKKNPKAENLNSFKLKWGGEIVTYPVLKT